MSHLILPIDLDGTLMCPTEVGGRGTKVAVTEFYRPTTPDHPLEFSLGVACGTSGRIRLGLKLRNDTNPGVIPTGTTWTTTYDIYSEKVKVFADQTVTNGSDLFVQVENFYDFTFSSVDACGSVVTFDVKDVVISPGPDHEPGDEYSLVFDPDWVSIS